MIELERRENKRESSYPNDSACLQRQSHLKLNLHYFV